MTTAASPTSPPVEPPRHGLTPGTARGSTLVSEVPPGVHRARVEPDRHVDAERHAAGLHPGPHRATGVGRRGDRRAARTTAAVLSIPAGALADKVSKQKLMLWMQTISVVLTLGTAVPRGQGRQHLVDLLRAGRHRHGQCAERSGVPGIDAAARAPFGPARRDQPELGDDQRHACDGPGRRRESSARSVCRSRGSS